MQAQYLYDSFLECRRHRCAHKPESRGPTQPCVFSEYKDRYQKHPLARQQPFKPAYEIKPPGPFDGNTNYKQNYVPHKYARPNKRAPEKYRKPDGKVDGESTYRHDYPGKMVPPAASAKPAVAFLAHASPFDNTTDYQDTYRPWNLKSALRNSMKPDHKPLGLSGKMDGKSTFQTDYPGYYQPRRNIIRPPHSDLKVPNVPMEKDTTTRIDYTKKNIEPRKSAKPPQRPYTSGPFKGITTFQHDYEYRGGRPPNSFKPKQELMKSAPFDGDTSYGVSYRKWDIPRRPARDKEIYQPPTAKMDGETTFQHDYPDRSGVLPAKSAKPIAQTIAPGQPFDDKTTHREAYKAWDVGPVDKVGQTDSYRPPTTKFEGESTTHAHYKGQYAPRSLPVRQIVPSRSLGSMYLDTTYRDTFKGERPQSCPAKRIRQWERAPQNGYLYSHDWRGHSYYNPSSVQIRELQAFA